MSERGKRERRWRIFDAEAPFLLRLFLSVSFDGTRSMSSFARSAIDLTRRRRRSEDPRAQGGMGWEAFVRQCRKGGMRRGTRDSSLDFLVRSTPLPSYVRLPSFPCRDDTIRFDRTWDGCPFLPLSPLPIGSERIRPMETSEEAGFEGTSTNGNHPWTDQTNPTDQ